MSRSNFAERYAQAARSTNMSHSPLGVTDVDVLAATAWAHPLASVMFRAKASNDPGSVRSLYPRWEEECRRAAPRWGLPDDRVAAVSRASVNHWINDICPSCEGRKFVLLSVLRGMPSEGRDTLSDHPCPACHGTGIAPIDVSPRLQAFVEKAVALLAERFKQFSREAARRLQ